MEEFSKSPKSLAPAKGSFKDVHLLL